MSNGKRVAAVAALPEAVVITWAANGTDANNSIGIVSHRIAMTEMNTETIVGSGHGPGRKRPAMVGTVVIGVMDIVIIAAIITKIATEAGNEADETKTIIEMVRVAVISTVALVDTEIAIGIESIGRMCARTCVCVSECVSEFVFVCVFGDQRMGLTKHLV